MSKIFQYKIILAIIFCLFFMIAIVGWLFKVMHWPGANELLIVSMTGGFILWIVVLYDMIVSPIKKKLIWILTMLCAPLLVGILYTFLRDDMMIDEYHNP